MTRRSLPAAAFLIAPALAGCAMDGGLTARQQADARALAEARPTGAPVGCVPLAQIRRTEVRDDRTIDFFLQGGRVLRSTLPGSCAGLGFERSFSYRTTLDRLCSADLIRVNHPQGPGATCALGPFQPVDLPGG
ncbi:MAG: hypothetical protein ACK4K7_04540 [Allosphingosinicella sp.]|uniref:hypothetical protein n=1 Tax=Allosphingosinicella sp. TaxID=2823234 RepID=UPI0039241A05